jgi:hypothetical protein
VSGGEGATNRLRDCPGFVRFWTAATISGFGTYVTTLAIQVLIVLTLNEGGASVGLVNAARWLPYMLFGLVAGVLVGRSRRRPLLVTTDLGRGLLLIGVPVLALTHQLSIVVLMGVTAVFGLMSLIHDAAFQSFLPCLVPAQLLTGANARLDQSDAVAQTSGPVLAGGLVALLSAPWAVLVDAASYLVSGLLLLRIPVAEPPRGPVSVRGIRPEAMEGLRWVYLHATLWGLALCTHAWFLCSAVGSAVLHRMACARCEFHLPAESQVATALLAKDGLQHSCSRCRSMKTIVRPSRAASKPWMPLSPSDATCQPQTDGRRWRSTRRPRHRHLSRCLTLRASAWLTRRHAL